MSGRSLELAYVGDLILQAPNAIGYFDHCRDALARADVRVVQVEWPHTERGQVSAVYIPAPASPPGNLKALHALDVDIATLASNHSFDQGPFGVLDTLSGLHALGILTAGTGGSAPEARRPAVLERTGLRLGFLSYNAVGPLESWATTVKAGAAPVHVMSHYEFPLASPGSPPTEYTFVESESLAAMQADIQSLRASVDVVSVSLHKGLGFVHAQLAQYERPLAYAAIDAGADIVIGHHAHMLRGVEVYRGKPIFHGINHFVTAYDAASNPRSASGESTRPHPSRLAPGALPLPDTSVRDFPYSRDSRHTMIARVVVDGDGVVEAGFTPCWIDELARPVAHGRDAQGESTLGYVAAVTQEAGLAAELAWDGDRVVFFRR